MRQKIVTGFIAEGAEYLYRTGNVGRYVRNICEWFNIHPVLELKKGEIKLKGIKFGKYDKAVLRYVRGEMRHERKIDKTRLFITHASCGMKMLSKVKREVAQNCSFEDIQVTEASATISSNCGPNTIGVLYVNK
jgi:fatty acid-binding protein DegV